MYVGSGLSSARYICPFVTSLLGPEPLCIPTYQEPDEKFCVKTQKMTRHFNYKHGEG